MSLAVIRGAIRERLETLLTTADPAGPLAQVADWAGEYERGSSDGPGFESFGRTPAALIAFARETPTQTVYATTGELAQTLATLWTVFVVVCSPRKSGDATTTLDGVLDAVIDAVVGVQVTSVGAVPLALESVAPYRVRPGLFIYAVSLRSTRVLSTRPAEGETDPFEQFDGEVNPLDANATTDADALPLSTVRAEDLHD
ncbi:MAG: hypothetical protein EKK55_10195 [Rhodocyclaceae bacterium]|nr:MAG: hypothetical protein EKK55_10195 [Rhodocyclaceae bacterium]